MYSRLVEPFAGSAAVTLAAAKKGLFEQYVIGDRLEPLIRLWQAITIGPACIADEYETLWLRERGLPVTAYYQIRSEFNVDRTPGKLLYLLARCVKNAVRFNPSGDFNQSPDKRRSGTRPATMKSELEAAHELMAGRCEAVCRDFMELFEAAQPGDLFYLDPPYQGTSEGRDARYIAGVSRHRMIEGLQLLNDMNVPFILSYDGALGEKTYGDRLPLHIASRLLLDVGRSSQATLNGRDHKTIESLYISRQLAPIAVDDSMLTLRDFGSQQSIAFT
jgi:DNA adenine methylase